MKFWVAVLGGVLCAFGQEPPAAPPAAPPAPAVLEYQGKPMPLAFQCTADDIDWAGLTCSPEEPCPIYLELAAVESVGQRIFAAGNIHSATVTLYSALLGSDDSGHTWREVHARIRGAGLDHIEFFDAEFGWAIGQTLFPLPQDPFLLVTSDGGQSWRRSPVFGESRENRFGTIQQVYFPSRRDGTLTVDRGPGSEGDRYEAFESADGGNSWTIKQTSRKPIPLKAPPPKPSDWRLRADGPSQAYHVEHRLADRWTNIAAFSVKLGACKASDAQ